MITQNGLYPFSIYQSLKEVFFIQKLLKVILAEPRVINPHQSIHRDKNICQFSLYGVNSFINEYYLSGWNK